MKSPFKRYPIRNVFFLAFAGFVTLLLVTIVIVSYQVSISQMQNNTSHYQQKLLREMNEQISIQKKAIEQVSLAMTRNSDLQEYLQGKKDNYSSYKSISSINASFFDLVFSMPMIDSIHLYLKDPPLRDQEGPIRYYSIDQYSRTGWLNRLDHADFSWLEKHRIQSPQGTISVISFARKVYSLNGKAEGVLVVNIKSSSFGKMLEDENGKVNRILVDSSQLPIASIGKIDIEDALGTIGDIEKNEDADLNSDGFMRYEDKFVVWSKLFNNDWLLVEITPWKEIAKNSLELAGILFLIGLIAILLVVLLTFYLTKQFTKPFKALLENMDEFSISEKELQLPNDYQNEFGTLFTGYKKMILRIKKLYEDLEVEFNEKRRAEVAALQANINPHFLYNTLDQLNWMAIAEGQVQISRVLELMGKMFRVGLSNGENFIHLKDELIHLESYLQIQQIRLDHRFDYRIDIPDSFLQCYIPKMTLQPFVENALIHGLHNKDSGFIIIKVYEVQNNLLITIKDNGAGLKKNHPIKKVNTGGYGIRNVRDRLFAYFGPSYTVTLYGEENIGTTALIKIPKQVILGDGDSNVESRNCG
ncbi:sensor histidine kinase [Bacillus sp. CMF21]|uniref:cache domain-containing sensor histidine kinase n=1 Tax=Metabacillus dongyingensis TaxID=2874282 RepID=UPI001CBEFFCF|nr:sensor histidine kinase [Metabacillus dongyingensis]UAL53807.1 sensor histidine kinase [Metabacillus dongyingensis]USK30119.1 sensor histidine kinase [Bacillus sp. CMF21]